jgi:hypothetical protein
MKCSECKSTDIDKELVHTYIQDSKLIKLFKLTCNKCGWSWNVEE